MIEPTLLPNAIPFVISAFAVAIGTVMQRLSGAGFGLLATPIMTLVAPDFIPGTILLLGFLVGVGAAFGARDAVERHDLPPGFLGRVLGAILAAMIATSVVGSPSLPVVIAFIVLIAVALNLIGLSLPITPVTLFSAGTLGGLMGTLSGIGAPPMAILYSNVETRRSAASQNVFFGFGMVVSILALLSVGLIGLPHVAFAAALAPIVPLSIWVSRPLALRFERRSIRPWALGLATLAALVLLSRSLS